MNISDRSQNRGIIGSTRTCYCGRPYVVTGGNQKRCSQCAKSKKTNYPAAGMKLVEWRIRLLDFTLLVKLFKR